MTKPVDGQSPREAGIERRAVSGQPDLGAGEFYVEAIPETWVWDSSIAALRPPTVTEMAKKRGNDLVQAKRAELILAFDADYEALWMIDGEVIDAWKDRMLFKAAANRTAAENNKLSQAAALFDKLQTKLIYLRDSVRTEAEINALSWTSTP